MKVNFFPLVVSFMALFACENKNLTPIQQEKENVTFEVALSTPKTRTETPSAEETVNTYQVFVYSLDSKLLETYANVSGTEPSVKLNCRVGCKEIVVLANAPDLSSLTSLSMMKQARSRLEHNDIDSLVMEGSTEVELTSSMTSAVEVKLKRIVAKVRLTGIKVNFESSSYDESQFELLCAYMINVPADKKYLSAMEANADNGPTSWYNQLYYISDPKYDSLLHSDINVIGETDYQTEHLFYCYPNPYTADDFSSDGWTERPTRLIVKAQYQGKFYYYPISLPGLKQNTVYDVSLVITRPGTTDWNDDMKKYEDLFTISVVDWETGATVEEIL